MLMSACASGGHTALSGPGASAPIAVRTQAYCDLRPATRHRGKRLDWAGSTGAADDDGLTLAGGRTVTQIEDLLGVVPSDSLTAKAVRSRDRLVDEADMMIEGGAVGGAGALTGMAVSVAERHGDDMLALWAIVGGFATLAISSGIRARMSASVERARAFDAYEASLRAGLALGAQEVTCPRR